ncbi:MAG: hypothetical protein GY797_17560 [Deltaproteobacteria bacterium]|nr:hypothetical protein [Deltaproteobacteria bacterium]
MTLTQHVKYTFGVSVILLLWWNITQIAWFALGSILIDFDHYLLYILRFKKFDIRGMFYYFNEWLPKNIGAIKYGGVCIFHTIEFYIITGIFSIYIPSMIYVLYGLLFHFVLDSISLYRNKCLFTRAFSIVEHFLRSKKHKLKGVTYV